MRNMKSLAGAAAAVVVACALAGMAAAQVQTAPQIACSVTVAKDAAKVAAAQGKINAACVKAGSKGDVTPSCPLLDPKGALAKAEDKASADEAKHCATLLPDFGFTGAAATSAAAVQNGRQLLVDTYGDTDLTQVISSDKATGACQAAVTKNAEKVAATVQKAYVACKKLALKGGAENGAALAACVGADPKGKVAAAVSKLVADAKKKCAGVDTAAAFPGRCAAGAPDSVANCLGDRAICQMCEAIKAADGLAEADCDLVDDGAPNGSCGLEMQACSLAPGSNLSLYASAYSAAVSIPITGGSLRIGGIHGVARCELESLSPITVTGLGVLCLAPGPGCGDGARYCGPGGAGSGPALGLDVISDATIGSCGGNAACRDACDVHCAATGTAQLGSGCVGYCNGMRPDGMACTTDAQCATAGNGACNGKNNPGGQAGSCQCTCVDDAAFGGSDPGDLQCNLAVRAAIETAAPCDGSDVQVDLGPLCIPLSTQRARGKVIDANFVAGATVPGAAPGPNANDRSGIPLSCDAFVEGPISGLQAVGAFTLFGTNLLGDLSFGVRAVCQ